MLIPATCSWATPTATSAAIGAYCAVNAAGVSGVEELLAEFLCGRPATAGRDEGAPLRRGRGRGSPRPPWLGTRRLEDSRVEIWFGFYEGRLYRVDVRMMIIEDIVRDAIARRPFPSEEERHQRHKDRWRWRKRVLATLQEKYGSPDHEPAAATLGLFCDSVEGGCNYASDATAHDFAGRNRCTS